MDSVLLQAVIYLTAAVVAVPIASRLGLGSVLGYLIAGVIIGPVIGLVGSETSDLQHFAEFGVVMMLFIVGLELEPQSLWAMRHKLLGLGGLQVVLSVLLIAGGGVLLGLAWQVAIAVGMVFSLSSTAIVLQTLNEKNLMKSEGGASSFSVLLFQDIAVIPMLAIIPLLAMPGLSGEGGEHSGGDVEGGINLVAGLAGWQQTLLTIGAVAFVIIAGHYLSRPVFRYIARSKLPEMFTAVALLLVIGIALLMSMVGLSPALGTFLAGVVLATSEYRHELESDIEPFKGLLLGLFFITVGAGVDFGVLMENLGVVLAVTAGVMAIKALVLFFLAVVFGIKGSDRWLLFLGLAQAGEFGFVLISFCLQSAALPVELSRILLLVVALSMLLTPALFIFFEKIIQPRMVRKQTRESDEITEQGTVVIAGHGRFGQVVNRLLLANGYKTVVLDLHADLVESMRVFEVKSFYGDASRPDLLHAAGLHEADLLVVAIDDQAAALTLIDHARRERPDLHIIARAYDRRNVYQLYQSGTNDIVRETADSALRAGRYALQALGMHPVDAERAATLYVNEELKGIRQLAEVYDPDIPVAQNPRYVKLALEIKARMDTAMLSGKFPVSHEHPEEGWRPPGNTVVKE
ncbi:monovalent cation:proton antiporter-2 (CPA2) family protein [Granulosicoccus antarcticus]|uniref:Glutathione-regulated potassium-efflux system protein KefC n=1 Tax=Granulosicoccus antarcticus IMCC3135 TaxID=1192854 RepID=A0A2Z2NZX5_9GAMM|nr:monovalent cation:proton antiporter-2 (CPA2) family protein [Granulosicoccus antarcticus]ASJ76005.1 Glutathione-regulated potassium-efflux system protein KefC [Granulosicoccus antarcticus IMCC3135]